MSRWSYVFADFVRSVRDWLARNVRLGAMIGALFMCGLIYVAFFLGSPFATREMVILHRMAPQWRSVVFSLDDDYAIREIEVVALGADGREPEVAWKARKAGEAPRLSTFAYGQAIPGMQQQVEAAPLREGATYVLTVKASGARGAVEFEFDAAPADRRHRGG